MKNTFNLLKEQFDPPTVWTKIYDWVLGSARLIMIFVQLIVAVAFGVRIVVDMRSKNLTDQIARQERTLSILAEDESRLRLVQTKVNAFRDSWEDSTLYQQTVAEVNSVLPLYSQEVSVRIQESNLLISGSAPASEVQKLEDYLDNSEKYKNTQVLELVTSGASQSALARFSIRAELVQLEKRQLIEQTE